MLNLIGFKVDVSILLKIDNSGAVDIANSWGVGGQILHITDHNYLLRELKDQ